MKNEELHEIIKNIRRGGLSKGGALGHHSGINDEIADLLEKQIPKKAIKDEYNYNCCPNCGWIVSYDEGWGEKYVPHCENCGQALDWSDEDEK